MVRDITINAKTIKELYKRKHVRKPKDPPTIHVIGKLVDLMLGKTILPKYEDPGNPVVTVLINNVSIPNTLVDHREAINIMTKEILDSLGLTSMPNSYHFGINRHITHHTTINN